jgi:hypothetical protein
MLVFTGGWDYIQNLIAGASLEQALFTLYGGLLFIRLGVQQIFDSLKEYVQNFDFMAAIMEPIRSALAELALLSPEMYQIGINILQGLLNGLISMKDMLWEGVKNVAENVTVTIRNFLGIKSPSRVMMEIGLLTSEGLAVGLEDGQERVKLSSESVAETATLPYNDTTSYFSSTNTNSYHTNLAKSTDLSDPTRYEFFTVSPAYGNAAQLNVNPDPASNLADSRVSAPAISATSFYNSPSSASSNFATTEINPVINITVNGDSSGSAAQDIAERVKQAIQEVFESAARRQGIAGGEAWQL